MPFNEPAQTCEHIQHENTEYKHIPVKFNIWCFSWQMRLSINWPINFHWALNFQALQNDYHIEPFTQNVSWLMEIDERANTTVSLKQLKHLWCACSRCIWNYLQNWIINLVTMCIFNFIPFVFFMWFPYNAFQNDMNKVPMN